MSNTVAKSYCFKDKVIPIPFEFSPSQTKPDDSKDIIVAFFDCIKDKKDSLYTLNINKVYDYYGVQNCQEHLAFMPYRKNKQHIFCISSSYLLEKIKDNDFPSSDLSPVWTIDRYGITSEEAFMALSLDEFIDKETNKKINIKKAEYSKILNNLKINLDKEKLDRIEECRELIENLSEEEKYLSRSVLKESSVAMCEFLDDNFPVKSYIHSLAEPIICYTVSLDVSDKDAVVIGNAVELLFNSIELEDIENYFDNFTYNVIYWPIIINKTFNEDGKRN